MAQGKEEDVADLVTARDRFHHPFTPYAIQETFMETVYQVLEDGKVGILESPNSDEPEWIIEQAKARRRRELLRNREDMEARLAKIRAKEKAQRDKYLKGEQSFKRRKVDAGNDEDDEEQFVLDDYESDREQSGTGTSSGLSAKTLEMMSRIGMGPATLTEEDEEVEDEIKIFYCSRTHSQLTQFINELRRVHFPPSIKDETTKSTDTEDLKHLTLGSRKNLCINPKVNKLASLTAINERCSELQQTSTPKEHKCVFLPNKENQTLVNTFRDHSLATIRDIEDMGELGKQIGICPYYASRAAIKPAEIVTLPYPLLLQKSAREALGLSVKGHVVIIDEAHNLMDAISGIHGVEVSLRQLKRARAQLGVYLQKFRNRLKGKNRVYVAQVVRVIDSLVGYLESRIGLTKPDGQVSDKDLLSGKGVDQINLFKLIKYLQESKLARKVESYALHSETQIPQSGTSLKQSSEQTTSTPVLHHISSLLSALTHPSKEGRLLYTLSSTPNSPDLATLKYHLLDPSPHFETLVSSARAVILAGGTMSPMSDYTSHLFPYLPHSSITTLSCGHVIPKENLLAWNLSKGPSGQTFDFTFKNRGNNEMIDDLGRALLNICTVVPDGVVVFFPSYTSLSSIISRWEVIPPSPLSTSSSSPPLQQQQSILTRLSLKKSLFQESKDTPVDTILASYASAISTGKGGLLFSVVGGKMSEGINFSDRLGRCVVIVGLPFPNVNSAEWKAKIEYIESGTIERLSKDLTKAVLGEKLSKEEMIKRGKEEAREFYESACMRAVNQSVGRAVRHQNDYAAIVMIDRRFEGERVSGKLPAWIREGLVEGSGGLGFGPLMGRLGGFFRERREIGG
ncbi:hypothetical protein ACEPPN_007695 [Leptodophora sp. 'Broadleaf-Isolate-01']